MCRCQQRVLLALGSTFLLISTIALGSVFLALNNTLSNSCSLTASNVHTAEAALSEELLYTRQLLGSTDSRTEEENVETEIPAAKPEPEILMVTVKNEETDLDLEYEELEILHKIVEAEAGSEDITGKMLVANVILNRVNSSRFPDTISEVVYQRQGGKAQFSPTEDGTLETVHISPETEEAVERVLNGEDNSNGALYFRSVKCTETWHDRALIRLTEYGNHIFYTL